MAKQQQRRPVASKVVTKPAPKPAPKSEIERLSSSNLADLLPLLGVLGLTFVLFAPTMHYDFVNWDDPVNTYENPNLRAFDWESIKAIFTSGVIGNYNPLPIFTFAVEKFFHPSVEWANMAPYLHTTNVWLHLLATFFVFRTVREMGLHAWAAAAVALLFGIHPMRVESVAWVTERKDVLLGVFFFAALWQHVKYINAKNNKTWHYILCAVLFAFALFSKIQAVTLPLSMLAVDYIMGRELRWQLITEKILHFLMALGFGLLGIYMLQQNKSIDTEADIFGLGQRLLIGASGYTVYWLKAVYPWAMSALYPYPNKMEWFHYASPMGVLAALAAFVYAFRHGHKTVAFAIFFFTANVFFLLQIVGAGQGYWADRFTYIGYFGIFFLVGNFIQKYATGTAKPFVWGIFGTYMLVMCALTYRQVPTWKDGGTMWGQALKVEDKTSMPWTNRAQWYRNKKQYSLAIPDYMRALQLKPKGSTYNGLAKLYFDQNKPDSALLYYNGGILIDTTIAEMYVNRGAAYGMLAQANGQQGNIRARDSLYQLSISSLTDGIRRDTNALNGYLNRALLYFSVGQLDKALADDLAYLRHNPYNGKIWYEAGNAHFGLGHLQEAITHFDKALGIEPNLKEAYYMKARAQATLGDKVSARPNLQKAISLGMQVPAEIAQQINN